MLVEEKEILTVVRLVGESVVKKVFVTVARKVFYLGSCLVGLLEFWMVVY
jgi:hypothetical protein